MPNPQTLQERPILFSAPMVRAILDGRKTQTRRVVKPQPLPHLRIAPCWGRSPDGTPFGTRDLWTVCGPDYPDGPDDELRCPYGVAGDVLWVRETCAAIEKLDGTDGVLYPADGAFRQIENTPDAAIKWLKLHTYGSKARAESGASVPSIHMPRWASRITLRITDVRVERLQEISETGCKAEGVAEYPCGGPHRGPDTTYWSADGTDPFGPIKRTTPVLAFKALWEEINGEDGPGAWDANPWVWVVAFERIQQDNAQ